MLPAFVTRMVYVALCFASQELVKLTCDTIREKPNTVVVPAMLAQLAVMPFETIGKAVPFPWSLPVAHGSFTTDAIKSLANDYVLSGEHPGTSHAARTCAGFSVQCFLPGFRHRVFSLVQRHSCIFDCSKVCVFFSRALQDDTLSAWCLLMFSCRVHVLGSLFFQWIIDACTVHELSPLEILDVWLHTRCSCRIQGAGCGAPQARGSEH